MFAKLYCWLIFGPNEKKFTLMSVFVKHKQFLREALLLKRKITGSIKSTNLERASLVLLQWVIPVHSSLQDSTYLNKAY